ncbi:hypothetical protein GQX74_009571 [Glossina fuscipes]|nr:hypothetical protein GQX74_009571 [Glossina fuscipes]
MDPANVFKFKWFIYNTIELWASQLKVLNVRLPVTILLQMICYVNGRFLFLISFKRLIHFYNFSNGYHLDTAVLLSVFTGTFGLDRFYLGY